MANILHKKEQHPQDLSPEAAERFKGHPIHGKGIVAGSDMPMVRRHYCYESLPAGNPGPGSGPHGAVTDPLGVDMGSLSRSESHYARKQLRATDRENQSDKTRQKERLWWRDQDVSYLKKLHMKKQNELLKSISTLNRTEEDLQFVEKILMSRRDEFLAHRAQGTDSPSSSASSPSSTEA